MYKRVCSLVVVPQNIKTSINICLCSHFVHCSKGKNKVLHGSSMKLDYVLGASSRSCVLDFLQAHSMLVGALFVSISKTITLQLYSISVKLADMLLYFDQSKMHVISCPNAIYYA